MTDEWRNEMRSHSAMGRMYPSVAYLSFVLRRWLRFLCGFEAIVAGYGRSFVVLCFFESVDASALRWSLSCSSRVSMRFSCSTMIGYLSFVAGLLDMVCISLCFVESVDASGRCVALVGEFIVICRCHIVPSIFDAMFLAV